MENYYKKSKRILKKYIRENPLCTKEEWNDYANKNCLFSANTMRFHSNAKSFEELKEKLS